MAKTVTYTLGPSVTDAPAPLYQAPIVRIQVVRDTRTPAPRTIRAPADAYAALRERFATADREVMVALLLTTKNRLLAIDPVFVGCLDATIITMREAFKSAVLIGAAAVIFAHNHPSTDVTPSPEDLLITRQLCAAGQLLDIAVLDHLVLSDTNFISLREAHPTLWPD